MTITACMQEGCTVANTGKCLEGFDPAPTCPYQKNSPSSSTTLPLPSDESVYVELPSGEALNEFEASEVAAEGVSKVVIVAGPVASGKTTLITSLYQAFLEAPFASYGFAGSRTLMGFERRCHESRVDSGLTLRHTARTPITDTVEFLHLRLASSPTIPGGRVNLLLSDVSGERFDAIRDSAEAINEMKVLRRADFICIVVDGEGLRDINKRHSSITDARLLLRSLIESNVLSGECKIQIVFSKWDLVSASPQRDEIFMYVENAKNILTGIVNDQYGIQFFEVAARPESIEMPFAYGLPTVLRTWMDIHARTRTPVLLPKFEEGLREFLRFAIAVDAKHHFGQNHDVRWL